MSNTNWLWLVGIIVVGAAAFVLSVAGPEPAPPRSVNGEDQLLLPFVDAGPNLVINECSGIRLTCEGYDPDGSPVTYQWAAAEGRGSFNDPRLLHPVYTAPEVCRGGENILLNLTVTNARGVSNSDRIVVRVCDTIRCPPPECLLPKPMVNRPPVADAGEDIVVTEHSTVRLTCRGYDPDGDPVTYYWTATGGRGAFDNPRVLHPRYTAPAVDDCEPRVTVFLTLTVTDSHGASSSDSVTVHVSEACPPRCPAMPVPCDPVLSTPPCPLTPSTCPSAAVPRVPTPTPRTCTTPYPLKAVDEGGSIQLHGKVWDPDCNLTGFHWTADKGRFDDPTSLDPIYYAPMTDVRGGEDVCITLTAVDSCFATGHNRILLHINNVNHPPTADAGESLVVGSCADMRLTCSASDPDGDRLTYYWTAECGRGHFSDPRVLHPVYTTPPISWCGGEDIVLTLTVTDEWGASSCDSMIVHVRNENSPPKVEADP